MLLVLGRNFGVFARYARRVSLIRYHSIARTALPQPVIKTARQTASKIVLEAIFKANMELSVAPRIGPLRVTAEQCRIIEASRSWRLACIFATGMGGPWRTRFSPKLAGRHQRLPGPGPSWITGILGVVFALLAALLAVLIWHWFNG